MTVQVSKTEARAESPFISFSQNFEDVMLWKALKHVQGGRYIDIGAADPRECSVSHGLYLRGWRGIHVEPLPQKAQALRAARPDEVVLETAIGLEEGRVQLHEVGDGLGLSTCDHETSLGHRDNGMDVRSLSVACRPLSRILDEFGQQDVHWLKIDVEGFEEQVIRSWSPSPVRPWVVLVESTLPGCPTPNHHGWDPALVALGYRFVYFDGLNRFYISDQHPELADAFASPPNIFDNFQVAPHHHFAAPLPAPPTGPHRPLPVRAVRRVGGMALRSLVSFVRRHPTLHEGCSKALRRVPPLQRLLSRVAGRFGGPQNVPQADRVPPAAATTLLTQAREHLNDPLALR